MNTFWSNPVLRSLLIGVFTVGVMVGLFLVSGRGFYHRHIAGLPGMAPALFGYQIVIAAQISWVWAALSIIGSYAWHTRRLERTTRMGKLADILMWIQYVLLLLLALLMWLSIPNGTTSNQPVFG